MQEELQTTLSIGAVEPPSSHVTVHLADTADVQFQFERTQSRMSGAFGASVAAHAVSVLAFLLVAAVMPDVASPPQTTILDRTPDGMVFLPQVRPGRWWRWWR